MANDGQADSNTALVTITVSAVNTAPVAADDAYRTSQDQPLAIEPGGALTNDQDAEGDTLAAVLVNGPSHGTLVLNDDGSFTYTPNAGFSGEDTFSYVANDGQADSNTATVSLTVDPAVTPPAKQMVVHLEVASSPFGEPAGAIWAGGTFWVNAYVEDLRDIPQGVVGGAIDVAFDTQFVLPTGDVVYGEQFSEFRQGTVDVPAGVIDEAGALATQGGVGSDGLAPFMAWQFRRSGAGTPSDVNGRVTFAADPGEGTSVIQPAEFALVGDGSPVAWSNVQFDTASVNLFLGDFNGDGRVNHCDLALWIPQALLSQLGNHFDPQFDLNGDAKVDGDDLGLLLPRLYQPVLPDVANNSGNNAVDVLPQALLPGQPANRLEKAGLKATRLGRSVAEESNLDWAGAIRSNQAVRGTHRVRMAAVDLAFQGPGDWYAS